MKKIKMILVASILLFISENISPAKATAQVSVSFQYFYDGLSPYGNWVSYPGYGYAWVPGVGNGFRPYVTGGRWVFTDLGWTWVSNYDWGWAPFHYGSWLYDPGYGWLWVPGYSWAPAWVVWGTYGDYYGWAPCAPGFSISVGYHPPIEYWCFSQPSYIASGTFVSNHYIATNGRISIGSNTSITTVNNITVVNNTNRYEGQQFNSGPPRQDFERMAKTSVQPVAIKESSHPGKASVNGGNVEVYRPKVTASDKNSAKPAKVTPIENIKPGRGNTNTPAKDNAKQTPGQPAQPNNNKNINRTPVEKSAPAKPERKVTPPEERKQAPSQSQERKASPPQQSQPRERKVSPPQQQAPTQERNQVAPPRKESTPQRQAAPRHPQQQRQPVQRPPEMRQQEGMPPAPPHPEPQPPRQEEPKGPHGPK